MLRTRIRVIAACAGLLSSGSIFAAAFQFYELGTPIIGTAAVGQAAVAYDASISYFNPAGMTRLLSSQYMLGSQLILPYTNFSPNTRSTIRGDNGGQAATLTPGGDFYFVYSFSPQLKFGASLTAPYGGLLTYNDGWVGRFNVQNIQFYTLDFNPALAYQINQYISIGAGVTIEYANLHQTVALPLTALVDGQANVKVDNTSAGVNLGLYITPSFFTRLGIAYRSQIMHKLQGNTTFLRLGLKPKTSTHMVMPQTLIVSLAQDINQRFTLLGEAGWANWASMKNSVLNVAGFTATTVENWHNTYRLGLAAQTKLTPAFLLQAGASYDSSPTSNSRRLPELPMDRQIRLGAGLIYSVAQPIKLGFAYEYINLGNANVENVSNNGILTGSYSRNYANVFQASINVEV